MTAPFQDIRYFRFLYGRWACSQRVLDMSLAARGAYITMLAFQGLHGSVPADINHLARRLNLPLAELRRVWPEIAPHFQSETDPDTGAAVLFNPLTRELLLDGQRKHAVAKEKATKAARSKHGTFAASSTAQAPRKQPVHGATSRAQADSKSRASTGIESTTAITTAIVDDVVQVGVQGEDDDDDRGPLCRIEVPEIPGEPPESRRRREAEVRRAKATQILGPDAAKLRRARTAERFAAFWAVYPRKDAKAKAQAAWGALDPDDELTDQICAAVRRQRESRQWREAGGEYIPLPTTYLHQRRWEDQGVVDLPPPPHPSHSSHPAPPSAPSAAPTYSLVSDDEPIYDM